MARTIKDIADALRVEAEEALKIVKSLGPKFRSFSINTELDNITTLNISSQIALNIDRKKIKTKRKESQEINTSIGIKIQAPSLSVQSTPVNTSLRNNNLDKHAFQSNSEEPFANQAEVALTEKTEVPRWIQHELNTRFILDRNFPFCILSNILLFNAQKAKLSIDYERNGWISDNAIEIDHLLHQASEKIDRLFIIECKNRFIEVTQRGWFVQYRNGKNKNIQHQLRGHYEALKTYVNPIGRGRSLEVVAIVVTSKQQETIKENISNGFCNYLVSINKLADFLKYEFPDSFLKVSQSDILDIVRLGIPVPETGHPELSNALTYIERTRRNIDNEIYQIFKPTEKRWAINGSAGMGKSVLLAYSLCVFSSNRAIKINESGEKKLIDFTNIANSLGIPPHGQRKVYAYALKEKQKDVISLLFRRFADEFSQITEENELSFGRPSISVWQGVVPDDCQVLLIDEAHDLSDADADYLEKWLAGNDRYLLIACDRHQKLSLLGQDAAIIKGISFSLKTKKLRLNYRNPFPVYAASIGLMFKWFCETGPKVVPSKDQINNGFGFEVDDKDRKKLVLSMKNDSHPGNRWSNCVETFANPQSAFARLKNYGFKQKDVLWVRFAEENEFFDYEQLSNYTYHNLNCDESVELADKYIKGQDFPIVVIEGMAPQMCSNQNEDEVKMWQRRRELYICCSRATAFLFLIAPNEENHRTTAKAEFDSIAKQLSTPIMNEDGVYVTWQFAIPYPNDEDKRSMEVFTDTEEAVESS